MGSQVGAAAVIATAERGAHGERQGGIEFSERCDSDPQGRGHFEDFGDGETGIASEEDDVVFYRHAY